MHSALGTVSKGNHTLTTEIKIRRKPGVHFRFGACTPCGQNLSGIAMLGSVQGAVHGEEVPILSRRSDLVKLPPK